MIGVCLLTAAVSILLMALFSYNHTSSLVEQQAYQRSATTVTQAAAYIDDRLRNVLAQVYSLVIGSSANDIQKIANDTGNLDNTTRATVLSSLQPIFDDLRVREPLIRSVFLYTPGFQYYELTFQVRSDFRQSRTFQQSQQLHLENGWLSPRSDEIFNDTHRVIPLVVPLHLLNNLPIAYDANFLIVNLDEEKFSEYLRSLSVSEQNLVYLAAADGTPNTVPGGLYQNLLPKADFQAQLQRTATTTPQPGSFEYTQQDQLLFVNSALVATNGWQVVSLQPKSDLLAGLADIQRFTWLVSVICLVLSMLLSSWLAATITRPLASLKKLMQRAESNDLSVRFGPPRYHDEVGELGHAFNSMLGQIQQLLVQVEDEQLAKRQAELKALQAQINPHFLYNTLDSIYWKALMNENGAVAEMAISLSTLFRLGLNAGREMTTLAKELEHVRNYLEIQKLCYGETFSYTIKCDPALSEMPVVKLILQPLVENSLLHGFELMQASADKRVGLLEIEAQQAGEVENGRVCLSVSDNGCGFDPAQLLTTLNLTETEMASGHGYALRNVHARLRLHYGAEYQLKLTSQPNLCSRVELWLPATTSL
jgi:two-component system sensor histidine kinase YesM